MLDIKIAYCDTIIDPHKGKSISISMEIYPKDLTTNLLKIQEYVITDNKKALFTYLAEKAE